MPESTRPTLAQAQGAPSSRMLATGSVRGSRVVSNEEMCTMIDSTPEWIQQRTGITERRWATPEETPRSMAVEAARKALAKAGLEAADVDAVVIATVSPPPPPPPPGPPPPPPEPGYCDVGEVVEACVAAAS